jgi:hypothetical protein
MDVYDLKTWIRLQQGPSRGRNEMDPRASISSSSLAALLALMALALLIPGDGRAEAPSGKEQFLIYELNRARSDPGGWGTEQGLPVDLSYVEPRPPLAINEQLVESSGFHAKEMADHEYFGHTSEVTEDQPNQMAIDAGYPLPFPAAANSIESIACGFGTGGDFSQAIVALETLIVDEGVPSLGHRKHLLGIGSWAARIEIGAGFDSASTFCRNYWSIQTANESTPRTFLTGVVFDDANGNDLYEEGEGLGGVGISANQLNTTSNASGGWSLEVSDGTYGFSCTGGSFVGIASESIHVSGQNREVDCISAASEPVVDFGLIPAPEPSGLLLQGLAVATTAAMVRGRRGWNPVEVERAQCPGITSS